VSTNAADEGHGIEPLPLADSPQHTIELLTAAVGALPGSRSVLTKENYLHFEVRSPWLGFVDDVEFLIDMDQNVVQARSASRVGRSDFGVNRKRMEEIRRRYEAALRTTTKPAEESIATTRDGDAAMPDEADEFANIEKSDEEWRRQLTREQYYVTRQHGTERAFTGPNWDNKEHGVYSCVGCGLPLFSSETKYESGTGWPSFWEPLKETSVETQVDVSYFSRRTEVHCRRCKGHLGHVFEDGPDPTGLRYCMNGVAMKFEPAKEATDGGTGTNEKK
jgi:peptide-methionine (R)-S-oxide reductase